MIADHYRESNHLASPPVPIQRLVFKTLAPIGRLLGYRAYYPEYGPSDVEIEVNG